MRVLSIASALLIATASLAPQTADAQTRRHRHTNTMNVKLANGRIVTFHIARVNGQMMAMAPYNAFRDVFHGASAQ